MEVGAGGDRLGDEATMQRPKPRLREGIQQAHRQHTLGGQSSCGLCSLTVLILHLSPNPLWIELVLNFPTKAVSPTL